MTARKSGNHIYVEGDDNTLSSVTADIADTTFIEETSPGIFTVKENVNRYFYIRPGGTLTIGDANDYSVSETLQFDVNTANYGRFYVNVGGVLNMYGNTTLSFSSGSQRPYYAYIYGQCNILGNDTYKPVWQNFQRLYFYETSSNNTYANDIWHFEKMILGGGAIDSAYGFFFSSVGRMRKHVFKDITIDDRYGKGGTVNAFYFSYGFQGSHQVTFEGMDFVHCRYPIINYGMIGHFKNCTFRETTTYKTYTFRTVQPLQDYNARDYGVTNEPQAGQYFVFLDGCTYTADNYAHSIIAGDQARVLVRDCDFQRTASGYYIYSYYSARVYYWTGNTEAKSSGQYSVSTAGAIQWVHGLDVTVQDADGNAIEGATVVIEQSEGKEQWTFVTDANGKLVTYFDLGVAILTHRHQYGSSLTYSEYWSDASNGTYHTVTAFKDGYDAASDTVVMDDEKTLTLEVDEKQVGSIDAISLSITEDALIVDITDDVLTTSASEDAITASITEDAITTGVTEEAITESVS